jgi:pseudouridine synthase
MGHANVGSRRASEALIKQGRVTINGKVATLGDKADPETDVIEVDGARLKFDQKKLYIMVNKPRNVLTTNKGHEKDNRRTILDLIPFEKEHLFTIGRLDADSEGLVVLTNDGELANKLTHPRYHHTKAYRVVVQGLPTPSTLERWMRGVYLEDEDDSGMTAPCYVAIAKGGQRETVLRVVMTEGRKRQIRRVAQALGHPVQELKRTQIGMLELGDLKLSEWRELTKQEIQQLNTRSSEAKNFPRSVARRGAPRREGRDDRSSERRRPYTQDDSEKSAYPRRKFGDRPTQEGESRPPRRPFRQHDSDESPRRKFGDRPTQEGESRPPRRPFKPRDGEESASNRPSKRPSSSRPSGSRPFRSNQSGGSTNTTSTRQPFRGTRPSRHTGSGGSMTRPQSDSQRPQHPRRPRPQEDSDEE